MISDNEVSHFCNDKNSKYFMFFNAKTKLGRQLQVPYTTKFLFDSAQIKNMIFFTGGGITATDDRGEQFFQTTVCLTIENDMDTSTEVLENMNVARANHTMVAVGEKKLYVIGGCNTKAEIPACEVYDLSVKKWKNCASLNERKMWVTVCVVDSRYLYAFGGATNLKQKESSMIECLDTEDSSAMLWKIIRLSAGKEIWPKCFFTGAYQVEPDCVMIFGGLVNQNEVSDSYYFNTKTMTITKGASLVKEDAFYRTKPIICCGEMVVVGSNEGDMHIYNIKEKKWTAKKKKDWYPETVFSIKSETY